MTTCCVKGWSRLALCVSAIGLIAASLTAPTDAEARQRRVKPAKIARSAAQPASFTAASNYAALVVDAKTGRVLFERNADAIRFPASVTKVMTLYLVFEDLERGRINLGSNIMMSARCAAEAPSKLGLRPGQAIDVEDGIKALVTKSANDVACAFAENLEGSVPNFAERMTRKARAIGMSSSVFRNASGLPNPSHVTTARDLVTLGRAIQDRFPRYYGYFGTRVFNFAGRSIGNHNKLLGRVEGVDGIKTGYTNASGFNLLSSVKSNGRSIVAVVMGGRTGPSRDAHMRELIALNLPKAQPGTRTAPLVAEGAGASVVASRATRPAVMASAPAPVAEPVAREPERVAAADIPMPTPAPLPAPRPAVMASGATPKPAPRVVATDEAPAMASVAPTTTPGTMRWVVGRAPNTTGSVPTAPRAEQAEAAPAPAPRPVKLASASREVDLAPKPAPVIEAPITRKGWLIQIGATTEVSQAKELLSSAKAKGGKALSGAEAFTETFVKGDTTYYRARFAGLNEKSADAACKTLKRSSVSCFAIKN